MGSEQSGDYPRLGRYQIVNRIASGGMAEVFLARAVGAMGFQRLVAVKLIHSNFTRDTDFVKMFIDEARIAMHLHHRNVVQVFDLDQVDDTYFIAMEYVHGVNLYDVYERIAAKGRWFDTPMALYLAAEVSKGLHFAHTRTGPDGRPLGIVHRDISPQNVLLSFEGEVKITDFGIATAAERLHQTAAGVVKGKYAYMAPERLQDQPTDARVDVFGVGVLLYELLVGENPFAAPSAVDTIENVLGRDVPSPSERGAPVSRRLDEIVLKALAKDPRERYRSGQALADAVTEYALELTHARKDMAAGDSAVATLLAELFPERARRPPTFADPRSLGPLPGVVQPGGVPPGFDTSPDPTGPSPLGPADPDTEELPPGVAERLRARGEEPDDPTVLKLASALHGSDLDEPVTAQVQDGIDLVDAPTGLTGLEDTHKPPGPRTPLEASGRPDDTLPTVLPSRSAPRIAVGSAPFSDDEIRESFMRTVPSQSGLDILDDPEPSSDVPLVTPARTAPAPLSPMATSASISVSTSGPSAEHLVVPVQGAVAAPRRRPTRLQIVAGTLVAVAALVVAAAVLVVGRGARPAEVALTLTSTPPGAEILLNGRPQATPTPATVSVLANQPLVVELQKAGFERFRRELRPPEGAPLTLEAPLVASTGSVVVKSVPPGARVLIDGQDRGAGPVTIPGLPLGKTVAVRVELEGHAAAEETLTLDPAAPHQAITLTLAREAAAPAAQAAAPAGQAAAPAGQAARPATPATLQAAMRKVTLVAPDGKWASVYHAGRHLGTTPVEAELPVGKVELEVRNDEADLARRVEVTVPASGATELRLPL